MYRILILALFACSSSSPASPSANPQPRECGGGCSSSAQCSHSGGGCGVCFGGVCSAILPAQPVDAGVPDAPEK